MAALLAKKLNRRGLDRPTNVGMRCSGKKSVVQD